MPAVKRDTHTFVQLHHQYQQQSVEASAERARDHIPSYRKYLALRVRSEVQEFHRTANKIEKRNVFTFACATKTFKRKKRPTDQLKAKGNIHIVIGIYLHVIMQTPGEPHTEAQFDSFAVVYHH